MALKFRYWHSYVQGDQINATDQLSVQLWLAVASAGGTTIQEFVDSALSKWTVPDDHTIIVRLGGSTGDLTKSWTWGGGQDTITVKTVGDHIRGKLREYLILKGYCQEAFQRIKDEGYGVTRIAMDIEGGWPSRAQTAMETTIMALKDDITDLEADPPDPLGTTDSSIDIRDVIEDLYTSGTYLADGIPHIDWDSLVNTNLFASREGRQTRVNWNAFIFRLLAKAWHDTFAVPARTVFGRNCHTLNYEFASPRAAPNMVQGSNHPQRTRIYNIQTIGNPVVYSDTNAYAKDMDELENIANTFELPFEPWIYDWRWNGANNWLYNDQANWDAFNVHLENLGVKTVYLFGTNDIPFNYF